MDIDEAEEEGPAIQEVYKRLPPKFHTAANDIYVTKKTKIIAQFTKCKKILDRRADDIVIHALGAAINQALVLALKLENAMQNSIRLDVVTSTVHVTDDILTLWGDNDISSRQRNVSAVHIYVSRIQY